MKTTTEPRQKLTGLPLLRAAQASEATGSERAAELAELADAFEWAMTGADRVGVSLPPWGEETAPAIPAGSARVRLGGSPPRVAVRVLSEENYQHAVDCVNFVAGCGRHP